MKYYTLPPKPVPTHSRISADGNPSLPVAQAPNLELIHFFLSLSVNSHSPTLRNPTGSAIKTHSDSDHFSPPPQPPPISPPSLLTWITNITS